MRDILKVLQLSKFPHFEGEGGDEGPGVDGLNLVWAVLTSTAENR
jgi:hypothetical protein